MVKVSNNIKSSVQKNRNDNIKKCFESKSKKNTLQLSTNDVSFSEHIPVLLHESINALFNKNPIKHKEKNLKYIKNAGLIDLGKEVCNEKQTSNTSFASSKIYLDCTFGRGGHAEEILKEENTCLIAIDRDIQSLEAAKNLKKKYSKRFLFINICFSDAINTNWDQIIDSSFNILEEFSSLEYVTNKFFHDNLKINDEDNEKVESINHSFTKSDNNKVHFIEKENCNTLKLVQKIERCYLEGIELNQPVVLKKFENFKGFHGVLMDLGISSPQIDKAENGFSYIQNGDIKMQMGINELSASDVLNNYNQSELARIFRKYGDEKNAWKIADQIINFRKNNCFKKTFDLVDLLKKMYPRFYIKTSSRIFQSLRIHVNNEISELIYFLHGVKNILQNNSVISIISFHSVEDRIVKYFFKKLELPCFKQISNIEFQSIQRTKGEVDKNNKRARSSILRFAVLIKK